MACLGPSPRGRFRHSFTQWPHSWVAVAVVVVVGGDSANSGPFGTKVKLSELTSPSSSDRENRWTRPIHAHGKTPPFHQ